MLRRFRSFDRFQKAEDISVNRCMVCCFQPGANGARVTSFHKSALAMKRFVGGLVRVLLVESKDL